MSKVQGVHLPSVLTQYMKNGGFDFFQEKVGNVTTVNTATTQQAYFGDMWAYSSGGTTVKNYSLQRSTDVPTVDQSGFQSAFSGMFTMISSIGSFAAGDFVVPIKYFMEGQDYRKLHSKTVTLCFWTKASVPGTYNFYATNDALNRSYVSTFTASNNWEFKTITLTLDNAGTWLFDNAVGLEMGFGAYSGTTYATGATNQWQAGNFVSASGTTNWMATAGATLRIAQVSLVEGSLGVGPKGFSRFGGDYELDYNEVMRYYYKSFPLEQVPQNGGGLVGALASMPASTQPAHHLHYKVALRKTPNITAFNYSGSGTSGQWRDGSDSLSTANFSVAGASGEKTGFFGNNGVAVSSTTWYIHIVADARLKTT